MAFYFLAGTIIAANLRVFFVPRNSTHESAA
jgi:hypothetical protein